MSHSDSPSTLKKIRNLAYSAIIILMTLFAIFFALDRAGVLRLPFLPHEEKTTEPYPVIFSDETAAADPAADAK